MEFATLLSVVGSEPVFETALLLAGDVDRADVHRQLSRWKKAGLVIQLRKGVYALAEPHRKIAVHPFVAANRLVMPSYVSMHSALSHHGMIPDLVPTTTSVTPARPGRFATALGVYSFQHIKQDWFWGYEQIALPDGQRAFVASPEKALLDLVHLQTGVDLRAHLQGLRLQNLDRLDPRKLVDLARRAHSPRLERAAMVLSQIRLEQEQEYRPL
jgi:predicted transcriptional regulator of viral defense system